MRNVVCKFGGSSLADAGMIRRMAEIVKADPTRRFIVPSAPGKRTDTDRKVTDLLYACQELAEQGLHVDEPLGIIRERYLGIASELGVGDRLKQGLDELQASLTPECTPDLIASRGEYLNGLIIAELLGATFVDPASAIFFDDEGRLDQDKTYSTLAQKLSGDGLFVIPGFFGADAKGNVKTFSRGGSDITGAVVAAAIKADVYENWTDVSGLLMADPRVVDSPRPMPIVTYRELRELSYMGANVLHDEALFPVRSLGIPVNIRNTHDPDHPGTMIVSTRSESGPAVVGIAGKTGFTVIHLEKAMMNKQRGFGRKLLEIIESHGISYEHTPSGIDTMSIVISEDELQGKLDDVVEDIRRIIEPDDLQVEREVALLAVVGQGMARRIGIAASVFGALAEAKVNIRMIDQGSSELNIIIGVSQDDFTTAVDAIYKAVIK